MTATDPPLIDMRSELFPRHRQTIEALWRLGRQAPRAQWVLVGGLMVMVIGREHGVTAPPRAMATKDGDLVVDLVSRRASLAEVVDQLQAGAFTLVDPIGSGAAAARCTFRFGEAQIDVLCPDGTAESDLQLGDLVSLAIPGGRRAIATARLVEIDLGDDYPTVPVMVPTLPGAIATKAAAALDPRTADQPRHLQDVAFLLSLQGPMRLWTQFDQDAVDDLSALSDRLLDFTDIAWAHLSDAERLAARATFVGVMSRVRLPSHDPLDP
jgi:hypothetical protein